MNKGLYNKVTQADRNPVGRSGIDFRYVAFINGQAQKTQPNLDLRS